MAEEDARNDAVILERHGELAVIKLGPADEKLSVLTVARMDSLSATVAELRKSTPPKGLIITGAQGNTFCAGADVKLIRDLKDGAMARQLAQQGQEAFDAIESLPFPTLAAISGACVGGGCELALSCDYRIMADTSASSIGLPEVKLGIIPGFGGTQRLPRLVGLRPALDIILKGKRINARQAGSIGLVDEVVQLESEEAPAAEVEKVLLEKALAFFSNLPQKKSPSFQEKVMMNFAPARAYAESAARKAVVKQTQGLYPAPPLAIDAVFTGLKDGMKSGLAKEAEAIGKLLISKECKSLVHIYFLTEEASKLGRGAGALVEGSKVSVLGGGTMGSGIATSFLSAGDQVVVVETSDAAKRKAQAAITSNVEGRKSWSAAKKKRLLGKLQVSVDLSKSEGSALVIEAIIEDLETKAKLMRSAAQHLSDTAILATNTSSLSVSALAEKIPNPGRVVGMHFFNPADRMPLVEIVIGNQSADKAVAIAAAIAGRLGKYPVIVRDVPGFLVNRIFAPYMVEAAYLLSAGYGIEVIDNAARSFGLPMGPLRLLDEVGLDVAAKVAHIMDNSYGDSDARAKACRRACSQWTLRQKERSRFLFAHRKETRC